LGFSGQRNVLAVLLQTGDAAGEEFRPDSLFDGGRDVLSAANVERAGRQKRYRLVGFLPI